MKKYIRLFNNHQGYDDFINTVDFVKPNVSHCIAENEVHYTPIPDPYNGHAYVDLGLPSGTKWATMNVGANSETDYGLYFQWGDTQGYTASQVGSGEGKKTFNWADYKWTNDGGSTMTKYKGDDFNELELVDDAARANWGGEWHMPTEAQYRELLNNTNNEWVTDYQGSGINGYLFTNTVDNSKTLFIPAASFCNDGSVGIVGSNCSVWASSLLSSNTNFAWNFYFYSGNENLIGAFPRFYGQSVRGVVS